MKDLIFTRSNQKLKMAFLLLPLFCSVLSFSSFASLTKTAETKFCYKNGSVYASVTWSGNQYTRTTTSSLTENYPTFSHATYSTGWTMYQIGKACGYSDTELKKAGHYLNTTISKDGVNGYFAFTISGITGINSYQQATLYGGTFSVTIPHGTSANLEKYRKSYTSNGSTKYRTLGNLKIGNLTSTASISDNASPNLYDMVSHVKTCNPSGTWYSNANQHYHHCTTCGYSDDYANHIYTWVVSGNTHYKKCSVCGYVQSSHTKQESAWGLDSSANKHRTYCTVSGCGIWIQSHAITKGSYGYDATNHWRYCGNGCGLIVESSTAHNNLSYTFKEEKTHTKKCGTCGYSVTENCSITNGQCTKCKHLFTATLKFDDNGGTGGPGTVEKQIGDTYIPSPNPTRDGYNLDAWGDISTAQ